MSGSFVFAVVQVDDDDVSPWDHGRLGTYNPVNMDGYYRDEERAAEMAHYMAKERPDLRTYLVKVIQEVTA